MCWVPLCSPEGHIRRVFFGGRLPFIVTKIEGLIYHPSYLLVGAAHIEGMMHGEDFGIGMCEAT